MHTSKANNDIRASGTLSIGAVATLTGISVHTLRAWEKRYQVVSVARSDTGRRLYRSEDVQRLRLLKTLTQSGHSIGNVAPLDNDALVAMLDLAVDGRTKESSRGPASRLSVCVYVDGDSANVSNADDTSKHGAVDVALTTRDMGEVRRAVAEDSAQAYVFYLGTITVHHLRVLRQLHEGAAARSFVVFSFAQRELIDELAGLGFHLMRAPVTQKDVFDHVAKVLLVGGDEASASVSDSQIAGVEVEVPPHKFSLKQLRQLEGIVTAIDCECPQHLSTIVRSLTLFESYSQQCASKNQQDALLHNKVYKLTAQARSRMEQAITLVIESENISLVDHE
tara:strand:- start:652 stop:1662 length:1011 start_codon:yes stop_codon:yes gene_type:complete